MLEYLQTPAPCIVQIYICPTQLQLLYQRQVKKAYTDTVRDVSVVTQAEKIANSYGVSVFALQYVPGIPNKTANSWTILFANSAAVAMSAGIAKFDNKSIKTTEINDKAIESKMFVFAAQNLKIYPGLEKTMVLSLNTPKVRIDGKEYSLVNNNIIYPSVIQKLISTSASDVYKETQKTGNDTIHYSLLTISVGTTNSTSGYCFEHFEGFEGFEELEGFEGSRGSESGYSVKLLIIAVIILIALWYFYNKNKKQKFLQ